MPASVEIETARIAERTGSAVPTRRFGQSSVYRFCGVPETGVLLELRVLPETQGALTVVERARGLPASAGSLLNARPAAYVGDNWDDSTVVISSS